MILKKNNNQEIVLISILLVDDDEIDQQAFKRYLKQLNLLNELKIAENGQEALDYVMGLNNRRIQSPYIILLDLNMPKMNGLEFLEELRNYPEYNQIPVVILTSSTNEEDICDSYEKHISGYISKPVETSEFMRKMTTFGSYWAMCNLC